MAPELGPAELILQTFQTGRVVPPSLMSLSARLHAGFPIKNQELMVAETFFIVITVILRIVRRPRKPLIFPNVELITWILFRGSSFGQPAYSVFDNTVAQHSLHSLRILRIDFVQHFSTKYVTWHIKLVTSSRNPCLPYLIGRFEKPTCFSCRRKRINKTQFQCHDYQKRRNTVFRYLTLRVPSLQTPCLDFHEE